MKIFKFISFLGVLLVLGAVDAADANSISYTHMIQQILLGVSICGAGAFLAKHTAPKPKKKHRAEIIPIEQLRHAG